jgi:hypothetical protein
MEEARQHSAVIFLVIIFMVSTAATYIYGRNLWRARETGIIPLPKGSYDRAINPKLFRAGIILATITFLMVLGIACAAIFFIVAEVVS